MRGSYVSIDDWDDHVLHGCESRSNGNTMYSWRIASADQPANTTHVRWLLPDLCLIVLTLRQRNLDHGLVHGWNQMTHNVPITSRVHPENFTMKGWGLFSHAGYLTYPHQDYLNVALSNTCHMLLHSWWIILAHWSWLACFSCIRPNLLPSFYCLWHSCIHGCLDPRILLAICIGQQVSNILSLNVN